MTGPLDPRRTYLELRPDQVVRQIPLTDGFWAELTRGERVYEGRLLMAFEVAGDSHHWEVHRTGEEILLLLSGALEVVLETAAGEAVVALTAGELYLGPPGMWHRFRASQPAQLVTITPADSDGTDHKPV